jgi:hypothetical protein
MAGRHIIYIYIYIYIYSLHGNVQRLIRAMLMINCNMYAILVCRGGYHTKTVLPETKLVRSTCPSNLLGPNIFGWLSNDVVYNVLNESNVGIKVGESYNRPQYAYFFHFFKILSLEILRPKMSCSKNKSWWCVSHTGSLVYYLWLRKLSLFLALADAHRKNWK